MPPPTRDLVLIVTRFLLVIYGSFSVGLHATWHTACVKGIPGNQVFVSAAIGKHGREFRKNHDNDCRDDDSDAGRFNHERESWKRARKTGPTSIPAARCGKANPSANVCRLVGLRAPLFGVSNSITACDIVVESVAPGETPLEQSLTFGNGLNKTIATRTDASPYMKWRCPIKKGPELTLYKIQFPATFRHPIPAFTRTMLATRRLPQGGGVRRRSPA